MSCQNAHSSPVTGLRMTAWPSLPMAEAVSGGTGIVTDHRPCVTARLSRGSEPPPNTFEYVPLPYPYGLLTLNLTVRTGVVASTRNTG